jgi:hypothetical protein
MGVTCKVGIIDYSVTGECGGSRGGGGKGTQGEEGRGKKEMKEEKKILKWVKRKMSEEERDKQID